MARADFNAQEELSSVAVQGLYSESLKARYMSDLREELAMQSQAMNEMAANERETQNRIAQMHRQTLMQIEQANLSADATRRARNEEQIRYEERTQQAQIYWEQQRKSAEAEFEVRQEAETARRKAALKIAAENDFAKADANLKQSMLENQLARDRAELASLQSKTQLTAAELARKEQLMSVTSGIAATEERILAIQQAKAQAAADNVPIMQRLAYYEDLQAQKTEQLRQAQLRYNAAIESAEALYSKDTRQYDLAIQAAQEERDNTVNQINAQYSPNMGVKGVVGTGVSLLGNLANNAIPGVSNAVAGIAGFINEFKKSPLSGINATLGVIGKLISAGFNLTASSIDAYMALETSYLASINTRLVGKYDSDTEAFNNLTSYLFEALGDANSYIDNNSLIGRLNTLVQNGISYNLEQRTILAELSDRMVSTFDMLDSTLTQLTRVQQADMSVAALGSEYTLTKFLNQNFEDSSYMSDMYDSVSSIIYDATANMGAEDATEFAYNVQKWLGSLYSLGMSSAGVQTIAQGINALATGDVEYFNSNDAARALFGLSTQGSYADILTSGLNAANVDQLMNNIISLLSTIATDTNQVTRSVKSSVFGGFNMTDLRAVGNLTTEDVAAIAGSSYTWADNSDTMNTLLSNATLNTSEETLLSNAINNLLLSEGENFLTDANSTWETGSIASTLGLGGTSKYMTYKLGQMLGGTIGTAMSEISLASMLKGDGILSTLDNFISLGKDVLDFMHMDGLDYANYETNANGNFIKTLNSNLIKSRGTSYALTNGLTSGISASTMSLLSSGGALQNFQTNEETITTGNTYGDSTYEAPTASEDLYQAFFVDQIPIKVYIDDFDDKSMTKLKSPTYKVSDDSTHQLLNSMWI